MKAVLQWVLKTMMKGQTGIVQTMPKKDIVDFNVAMTAERLMRNGVDPNSLKNANQVENALNMIENRPKVQEGITSTKSAKVFDMEGKEIPKGSKIMGGKAIDDDLPPPGSRGGDDDIAAPIQSSEETIKNMIEAENKKNIGKMRNRKMVKDAIDNVSPGFVRGDRKYNAQLVAEDLAEKKFGKEFYDLDQRQQIDLYDEALDGLSVDIEDFAQGGRAGFKIGSIDKARRAFLKTAASVGAGIGALKTGLLGLGKEAAPMVEAAKETVTQAPSYFFDLVAKIKLLGTQRRTPSYRERVNEYQYTGKDGNEYLLTEELDTGDIMIQKDKLGGRNYGDESYEVIEDRTEMVFRKGQADETTKGTPADEYEEYKVEFDQDGTVADATDIDELSKKEIIKEVTGDAPPIKKAAGGIARMLGE
jgi:hypothetical protein